MKPIYIFLTVCQMVLLLVSMAVPAAVGQQSHAHRNGRGLLTIPFTESWDAGTFTANNWTAAGNWSVRADAGNPSPAAVFTWDPVVYNYEHSLISDTIDALGINCLSLQMSFDVKTIVSVPSGNEYLSVDVWQDSAWVLCTYLHNLASSAWIHRTVNLNVVRDKKFRVRFRAHGINSTDIYRWEIDNIAFHKKCNPPEDPDGEKNWLNEEIVELTWHSPACDSNIIGHFLDERFETGLFPPQYFSQIITNVTTFNTTWNQSDSSSIWGVHQGAGSAGILWDYDRQDEWLIAHDIYVSSNLTFWSYAFQGSPYLDHYYVKISTNGGSTWTTLWDLSALPPYPSSDGWNKWQTPYTIDLTAYWTYTVDIAWQAVDGDGQGLWYVWAIDDISIGSKNLEVSPVHKRSFPDSSLIGYNVYRKPITGINYTFGKINSQLVTDTTYSDTLDFYWEEFYYYIEAVYDSSCIGATNSELVGIYYGGINEEVDRTVKIFPNPVSSEFRITGKHELQSVSLTDNCGRLVLAREGIKNKEIIVSTGGISPGLYFVDIITDVGVKREKLMILP